MSRCAPDQISRLSWRLAAAGLMFVSSAVIIAALLISWQGQARTAALTPVRSDEQWAIRAGRAEADGLTLQPAARSLGLALHPIESPAFTLQTRVAFNSPQGAAGLIVQADDLDHFSAFLISGDGYFRVSDYRNGAWIDRAAWRAWPHIRRAGSANVLRAECQSHACTFFVNDEWTWQEYALPAARRIGLIADAQAASDPFEARFDQIAWQP
jgi:hypothetical protein